MLKNIRVHKDLIELANAIAAKIKEGASVKDAAIMAGISEASIYHYLQGNIPKDYIKGRSKKQAEAMKEEFRKILAEARLAYKMRLLKTIDHAAQGTWQAAAWRLERTYPEEFAKRSEAIVPIVAPPQTKKEEDLTFSLLRRLAQYERTTKKNKAVDA